MNQTLLEVGTFLGAIFGGAAAGFIKQRIDQGKLAIPKDVQKAIDKLGGIEELKSVYYKAQNAAEHPEQRRQIAFDEIKNICQHNGIPLPDHMINLAIEYVVAWVKARKNKDDKAK